MYLWIENIAIGLKEYNLKGIYEIYDYLNIKIIELEYDNILLKNNESIYYRYCMGSEVVFIASGLDYDIKKFILAHELGHALLHPEIYESPNLNHINYGKLEKQANYFAIKLLEIKFDEVELQGMCLEQISKTIKVPYEQLLQVVSI